MAFSSKFDRKQCFCQILRRGIRSQFDVSTATVLIFPWGLMDAAACRRFGITRVRKETDAGKAATKEKMEVSLLVTSLIISFCFFFSH